MSETPRSGLSRREALAAALTASIVCAAPLFASEPRHLALTAHGGRSLIVSQWVPQGRSKGLILFSHGAASSPRFYEALISVWVDAGYEVLAPLHVDSLEHPDTTKYPGLASWKARLEDMQALSAHVGKRKWIAAGHSYGGLVALTLGGADAIPPQGMIEPLADKHVVAVIAFSPPAPIPVLITEQGFAGLRVPALIQTGTADIVPGMTGADGWQGHLVAFHAANPGGHRYGLILDGVDHYFGGAICRYDRPGPKQTERLADAARISTLFLDAHGRGEHRAKSQLERLVTDRLPVRLLRK